jgi:hypothetical protein
MPSGLQVCLLALVDIPDFGTPMKRIAGALERLAERGRRTVAGDARSIVIARSHPPPGSESERVAASPTDGPVRP